MPFSTSLDVTGVPQADIIGLAVYAKIDGTTETIQGRIVEITWSVMDGSGIFPSFIIEQDDGTQVDVLADEIKRV